MNRISFMRVAGCLFFLLVFVSGCGGESTKDAMYRVARERARAREADEAAAAKAAPAPAPAETPPAEVAPAAIAQAPPPAEVPKDAAAPAPAATPPEAAKPKRTYQHTLPYTFSTVDHSGKYVAHKAINGTIGVYNTQNGSVVRELFNRNMDSTCIGFGESNQSMIVGDRAGAYKVFALDKLSGLDRYQQRKYTWTDLLPASVAGRSPLTAVAISDEGNLAATGDMQGHVNLWRNETKSRQSLEGESSPIQHFLTVNNDKTLFAISTDRIAFWQLAQSVKSQVFRNAKLETKIQRALLGPDGSSILVADSQGLVTLWNSPTPESFRAHEAGILDMSYSPDNRELITVASSGEVARWPLPFKLPLDQMQPSVRTQYGDQCAVAKVAAKTNRVATASGTSISVFSLSSTNSVNFSLPTGMSVLSLDWVAQGEQLLCVAASTANKEGLVIQWNVQEALPQPAGIAAGAPPKAENADDTKKVAEGSPPAAEAANPAPGTPQAGANGVPVANAPAPGIKPAVPKIEMNRLSLGRLPTVVQLAPGERRCAVAFSNGECDIIEIGTQLVVGESIEPVPGISALGFTGDATRMLVGTEDGKVYVNHLRSLGVITATEAPIVLVQLIEKGAQVLVAGKDGDITLWNRSDLSRPVATFNGPDFPLEQAAISKDLRFLAARYGDEATTLCVWQRIEGLQLAPEYSMTFVEPGKWIAFTEDSNKIAILVGGRIEILSIEDKTRVGQMNVPAALSAMEHGYLPNQLILSYENEIQETAIFRIPSQRPVPGAPTPESVQVSRFETVPLDPTLIEAKVSETDPYAEAREALIQGKGIPEVIAAMGGNAAAQADLARKYENLQTAISNDLGLAKISQTQAELARAREKLKIDNLGLDYSQGMLNGQVIAETNFDFGAFEKHISINLQFSKNYLYALAPRAKVKEGVSIQRLGLTDNSFLQSWHYLLGIPVHAWDVGASNVSVVYPIAASGNLLGGPEIFTFNRDGTSRRLLGDTQGFNTKPYAAYSQYVTTAAKASKLEEHDLVRAYALDELYKSEPKPMAKFRGFETVVFTSVFANNQPWIAFGIRERAVSRLFIADVRTLEVKELQRFEHSEPWLDEGGETTGAAKGTQFAQFSPDDRMLVTWSEPKTGSYVLTVWDCTWKEDKLVDCKARYTVPSETPFFQLRGFKTSWFIQNDQKNAPRRMLVRPLRNDGFEIWNLDQGRIEGSIPYVATHYGEPEFAVSGNGCWIVQGDDKGMLYATDTRTGERFCVTLDEESARNIAETGMRGNAVDRPAHISPIVGVALTEELGKDFPRYAATLGEDNKLKLWDLYPVLNESLRKSAQIKATRKPGKK
jgi:WD40 repeat protein